MLVDKSINHMTVANASYASLLDLAFETGCMGVEVRNDLAAELFDGQEAVNARKAAHDQGLRLLALSEVTAFNDLSDRAFESLKQLAAVAKLSGAEAVTLIPRNDGEDLAQEVRLACLKETLIRFAPELEHYQIQGYVETLGFESCSLKFKSEVVDVIEKLGLTDRFKLVHDTFHHHLAGCGAVFPMHTAMVHISGVVNTTLTAKQMLDEHRGLVDQHDVLNNLVQINELVSKGYVGPISIEAFSQKTQNLENPHTALMASFKYIESNMAVVAA